jgi:hypothetical protein
MALAAPRRPTIRRRIKPVPTTLLEAKPSHATIANDGYHLVSRAFAIAKQAIFQSGAPLKIQKNQRGANRCGGR